MENDNSYEANLDDCRMILQSHLNHDKFEILNVVQSSLSNEVLGIMAGHYNIQLIYKIDKQVYVTNFFEKRMKSRFKIQDKVIEQQGAFKKEAFMYEVFFKKLREISNSKYNFVPKCYFTKKDRLLILENLKYSNFGVKRLEEYFFDIEHAKLALDTIAKFHSMTFVFEKLQTGKKQYSLFDEYSEMFEDSIYQRDENYFGNRLYTTSCKVLLEIIDESLLFGDDKDRIKNIFKQNIDYVYDLVKPAKRYYNVICHGDLWSSNILFKYDHDKPIECKLIDFQAVRYTVPAQDVMILVSQVSGTKFKDENSQILYRYYYNCLNMYLAESNIDINDYYSYEKFEESCDYVLPMVLIQKAFFTLFFILGNEPDLYMVEEKFEKFYYDEQHKREICLREYRKNGAFTNCMNEALSELVKLKPVIK